MLPKVAHLPQFSLFFIQFLYKNNGYYILTNSSENVQHLEAHQTIKLKIKRSDSRENLKLQKNSCS